MSLTGLSENRPKMGVHGRLVKSAILLAISGVLLSFLEGFSPATVFEPQSIGWVLWMSYARDLIQPFAFYFLIGLGERWLGTWQRQALLAFMIPALLELGQAVYYKVLPGRYIGVFDPLDILMYATGVGLAVLLDQKVFAKRFKFWE